MSDAVHAPAVHASVIPGPTIWGVPESYMAFLLRRRLGEHDGPLLHVARDDAAVASLIDMLGYMMPEVEVLRFPAWDCLPYDRVSPNPVIVAERAGTLARLVEKPAARRIILTTVHALVQRVPPRAAFAGQSLSVRTGETLDSAMLSEMLVASGYTRTDTVREPGEFATRGGIFDLFPAAESEPVRLDLFGDEVENIRRFDVGSQRSTAALEHFELRPVSEYALAPEAISRFRSAWRDQFGPSAAADMIYQNVSDGRRYPGLEHYLPLFHETMETLIDYLPGVSASFDHQAGDILAARLEMIADHYEARRAPAREGESPYRALPSHRLYLDLEGWRAMLSRAACATLNPFLKPDVATGIDAGGRPGPLFARGKDGSREGVFDAFRAQVEIWRGEGRRSYVTAWSRGSRERIAALLREHGIAAEQHESWATAAGIERGVVGLITLGVERGFVADRLALVSEQDLLGERIARPPRRKRRAEQFISEASELTAGDLVVHADYGIGRYDGLETVSDGVAPHDCLRLMYDGEQKLFLPVENIELLSRFGSDQAGVALDRLGGQAWQARKAKMKSRIRDMAAELIRTAAAREMKEAPSLAPAEGLWDEFCARFPFVETEDQSRAIADVLEDMSAGRPMDRLVCGDVGFGKTEVALRAAFVAAMSGVQVAVVVPTTLLSRQHFRSFSTRFEGFPIRVRQLSRLVTAKEAAETRQGLTDGTVEIIVGTHALLAKSIAFANLGLLIIDEEQHFGVKHKERLKALREDVHVLTLSATPLPRTLQLSLSGVREMSLIATPPTDRLAVRTFITPFDSVMIREAIQRERFRGGQIFCVVPRIEDMDRMAERLREIVPDAKTVQAHGRLAPAELERVMTEFSDGKYDILLSTNIVESGLDMPAVNTLIIHRADMFGLGQLYQLRGRVGRGKQRGYAYLTWPQTHPLSASSQKRLEIMQTLDTLGAGFTLASHDLDLRGAGNLLGEEQSGHIKEVGIELYQQMLEDTVADLRAEKGRSRREDDSWTPNIILGLPVLIPEKYVPDLPVRLGLYRRIAGLENEAEIDAMRAELVDRFGAMPPEVENLLDVVMLKRLCRAAGVERLEAGPKGMVLQFRNRQFRNPAGLIGWVERHRDQGVKLRPDHKLAVVREMTNAQRITMARKVAGALKKLAEKGENAA
ncbi:transcription-repair coupling factor [Acidomonas methanolica]|uniref:Transcription-repair-coupling factor n=1 Tax=Acidomonas methanolica NBRC 104435 TaxID=1231351 RepID=A0A023D4C0_ACIMT|nr:transcription-repair coupling factor [Acidomonas methanolica]MBU2653260.1 transcription-repair coupling factor [Acidomonas methanolica]TCS32209.1 transcription-repair coupling factor [Acidomonas methanolica]GAJ29013.1 DNA helicase transcription-repair coupling factor [Acidomonas methanolica NBRC 104435]GBQ56447.1 DNA helicase transcription-repair coupling factor [Acidomonas methanolica]GEK97643.1 transcription-repair-coupling factor [Acidomonas methanolica NBRC 104435]